MFREVNVADAARHQKKMTVTQTTNNPVEGSHGMAQALKRRWRRMRRKTRFWEKQNFNS